METMETNKGRWALGKMIIGIISIALFLLISLQSCAAGASNMLTQSGEYSGTAGLMTAICYFVGGITGLLTRNSQKPGGSIASCAFYWFAFFLSRMFSGSYKDLRIWGILAFIFGTVYLLSAMKSKKELRIASIISIGYFILGIA